MGATASIEKPKPLSAIAQYEVAGERIARLEEKVWQAERVDMPPLVRRVAAGDDIARAELKQLRADVAGWRQEIADGEQVLAELEDVCVAERQLLREQETAADFAKARKLAAQRLSVAQQLSDAVEALPGLMRQYDKLQQQEEALVFPHMIMEVVHSIPRRDSTDLMAARIGYLHLAGAQDSPRHRGDVRTIAELARTNIADWLRRLS